MKLAVCVAALVLATVALAEPEADAWRYYGGYGRPYAGYGYGRYHHWGKRSAEATEEPSEVPEGPNPDAYFYGAYPYAGYGYNTAYAPYTYGAYGAYPFAYGAYHYGKRSADAEAWHGYRYGHPYAGYGYSGRYYGKRSAEATEEPTEVAEGPNPDAYFYGAYPYAGYGYSHVYAPYTHAAYSTYPYAYGGYHYGKRSADADAWRYYGRGYGYGHRGYGYGRFGYYG